MDNKLTFTEPQRLIETGKRSLPLSWLRRFAGYLLPWRYHGNNRALYYSMALLIFLTAITPALQMFVDHSVYNLGAKANALVGTPNQNLARKFSYNPDIKTYVFNEKQKVTEDSEIPVEVQLMQHKLGGGGKEDKTLYSVDLPEDLSKGMTYYDNNLGLSFDLVPSFTTGQGKLEQNRLVYVNPDGGPKMVFTAMNNGLKEDMVFDEAPLSPDQTWQYKLNLPDTLAARTMSDGGVGIYSADPSLYKNVSFSGDMDEEKIKSARTSGEKSNLVFAIPAPFIKQSGNAQQGNAKASFVLSNDGKYLTVDATGLDKTLSYPLTVDPSVVITSTSDFATGNNEGNIDYPTDQITGGGLTGGSVGGSWAGTTSFATGRALHASVAYNGFMYVIGGWDGTSRYNDVQYNSINSNGTLGGTWTSTTSFTNAREDHAALAYNGFLYVIGGYNGSTYYNDVQYAPINANGTVGTWSATTTFTSGRYKHTSVAYNGYMYVLGGYNGSSNLDTVQYAPINANGTVGTWSATTAFPTARNAHVSYAYNGYMYVVGGWNGGYLSDVQYAPINANGTITVSTWASSTSFSTPRSDLSSVIFNGYMYVMGGRNGATYYDIVQYAPINANGTVGTWSSATSFTTARDKHTTIAHNGYLYVIGGDTGAYNNAVQYAQLSSPGVTGAYGTANAFTTARESHASVAYNGYLYVIGGTNGTAMTSIQYAALNANGTVGTWAPATALPAAIQQHAAVAYNRKLYVIGGTNSAGNRVDDIRRVDINANGSLGGTWTNTTFTTLIDEHAALAYNGYMYVIGGFVSGGPTYVADVRYASIDPTTGNLGAWTDTTDVTGARQGHTAVIYNSRIYVLGGYNGTTELADVQYSSIATNGTLGVWTTTTAFDDSRNDHTTVVYNGYIYVMAGHVGANMVATVQYAQLNTDGSVGSWAYTTALPSARDDHTSVVYNGFLYSIGGTDATPTYLAEVRFAQLNNNSSGITGTWTATNSITTARIGHTSVALNGYVYAMGGYTTVNDPAVQKGTIAANGTVTWASTTALPAGRTYAAAATYNGYIYVTGGGDNASARYDTIYYAKPDASGNIASWSSAVNLFSSDGPARHRHTSVAYNGYLYIIGGSNGTTYYNTVLFAPLDPTDGSVGLWDTTTSFTAPNRHRHSSVVYNGYLYVLGGTNETTYYSDVQYAQLNSNGTVNGSWEYTTSYDRARHSNPTVAYNGYIYSIGGRDGAAAYFDDVQYASINTNGTIGDWKKSSTFTTARQAHTSVIYNGFAYVIGGSGGSNLADVRSAPIAVMNRVGKYTKLIDIGHATISGITYNGSLANGADDITYRVADDTAVFGATVYSSDTVPAGMPAVCVSSSTTPTRYLLLTITLDESTRAGFPDSLASNSNVTDVTVLADGLRAPTNMRLMHGKWFKSEVQQPLDTCAQ